MWKQTTLLFLSSQIVFDTRSISSCAFAGMRVCDLSTRQRSIGHQLTKQTHA